MELLSELILIRIDLFLLVFVRMTGLFVVSPVFGRRNIPVYLKIGFSFMLAIIVSNIIEVPDFGSYSDIYQFAVLIFKEFFVGITLGYISYLFFTAIYLAGQLIDMQIGFGMVNVIDPMSNIQIPITSNFYFIISNLVFLTVNGHHVLIRALFESYKYVPIGEAAFGSVLLNDIVRVFAAMFSIGFKIAAPITASILIADVALGVISRTMPQLNIFVVGMPLKIMLGILVMMITIPMFIALLELLFNGMDSEVVNFLIDMGGKV